MTTVIMLPGRCKIVASAAIVPFARMPKAGISSRAHLQTDLAAIGPTLQPLG